MARYREPDSKLLMGSTTYSVDKLLSLAKGPVRRYGVKTLKWQLSKARIQKTRKLKADITKPILVTRAEGRVLVLDGNHRLAKAISLKKTSLPGRYIPLSALARAEIAPTIGDRLDALKFRLFRR